MQLSLIYPSLSSQEQFLSPGLWLDLALGADFLVDGKNLKNGHYQISMHAGGKRSIQSKKNRSGFLLSVLPAEKKYSSPEKYYVSTGLIFRQAYYYILQLLSADKDSDQNEALTSLLVWELTDPANEESCPIPFTGLQKIFSYLQKIEYMQVPELKKIPARPLDKKRFQLGCRFLYQRSFKTILRELRLNKSMQSLLHQRIPVDLIQENAGYRHAPSFKKAFTKKFMINPESLR